MKLFRLENGLGTYWVIANDPTQADGKLQDLLNRADYGFSSDRKVKTISIIAEQVEDGKRPNLTGKNLII